MKQASATSSHWVFTSAGKFTQLSRWLFLALLWAGAPGSGQAAGGVSVYSFSQDCRDLSGKKDGENATAAKLIIKSWVQGVNAQAALNADSGGKNGALVTMFSNAEDLAWCAASIEKFLLENKDSFPDDLTATEVLPLWWMSVHPNAEAQHKEILRSRLQALKERKLRGTPVRRFPK